MPFITASGERLLLGVHWNGVKSCPDFAILAGETIREAVLRSGFGDVWTTSRGVSCADSESDTPSNAITTFFIEFLLQPPDH